MGKEGKEAGCWKGSRKGYLVFSRDGQIDACPDVKNRRQDLCTRAALLNLVHFVTMSKNTGYRRRQRKLTSSGLFY